MFDNQKRGTADVGLSALSQNAKLALLQDDFCTRLSGGNCFRSPAQRNGTSHDHIQFRESFTVCAHDAPHCNHMRCHLLPT
jgi:hypothetical protein